MVNRSRHEPESPTASPLRALPARAGRASDRRPVPVLLPLIGRDDELDPAIERALHPVAIRAKAGDREARNALYRAFEPKLVRFVWQIRVPYAPPGDRAIWERDDVAQEGWLVFAALCEAWEPQAPFGRYVLANFPWRLRDAVFRGVARRAHPSAMQASPITELTPLPDHRSRLMTEESLIEALATTFESPLDDVIRHHILEHRSLVETASLMGVSRRSVTRYWQTILARLRLPDPAEHEVSYG